MRILSYVSKMGETNPLKNYPLQSYYAQFRKYGPVRRRTELRSVRSASQMRLDAPIKQINLHFGVISDVKCNPITTATARKMTHGAPKEFGRIDTTALDIPRRYL